MKIKEICEMLNVTRQGVYWMIEQSGNNLNGHAVRKPSGRWTIDDEGVEMLKEIRKQSKQVLVIEKPADPHAEETMSGMKSEINRMLNDLIGLRMQAEQGVFLANSIEELAKESKVLDVSTKRELLRLVKAFRKETTETAIKKRLKAEKKQQSEQVLEAMGQERLF